MTRSRLIGCHPIILASFVSFVLIFSKYYHASLTAIRFNVESSCRSFFNTLFRFLGLDNSFFFSINFLMCLIVLLGFVGDSRSLGPRSFATVFVIELLRCAFRVNEFMVCFDTCMACGFELVLFRCSKKELNGVRNTDN